MSLSEDNQSGVIEAFSSTSRYLDDLLNIDNNFFDSMVNRISPILRICDQVLTFDVFWPKHLREVRSTAYIHVQSI